MNPLFTLRPVRYLSSLLVILGALGLHGLVAADSETPVPPASAPIERGFRFLVVSEDGKPVDGIPLRYGFSIRKRLPDGKLIEPEVAGDEVLSANGGIVAVPKHSFHKFFIGFEVDEWDSPDWTLDHKSREQGYAWSTEKAGNLNATLGPAKPGFDAVFQVQSKKGLPSILRYEFRHHQVPCDGTPAPLNIVGGYPHMLKTQPQMWLDLNSVPPAEKDVIITIQRPDQELLRENSEKRPVAKPARVPWIIEGKTLRFAHFASDTDLSMDYRVRTWTQRIEVQPSEPDEAKGDGEQSVRLWAMLPGKKPLVFPMQCTILPSPHSWRAKKLVYAVDFEVIFPLTPGERFHNDVRMPHWRELGRSKLPLDHAEQLSAIRTAAIAVPFPVDLTTVPLLRYDTNPSPLPGEKWYTGPSPVLLTPLKP